MFFRLTEKKQFYIAQQLVANKTMECRTSCISFLTAMKLIDTIEPLAFFICFDDDNLCKKINFGG